MHWPAACAIGLRPCTRPTCPMACGCALAHGAHRWPTGLMARYGHEWPQAITKGYWPNFSKEKVYGLRPLCWPWQANPMHTYGQPMARPLNQ